MLPGDLLGRVLQAWDFITRFGKLLLLTPFALEV